MPHPPRPASRRARSRQGTHGSGTRKPAAEREIAPMLTSEDIGLMVWSRFMT